MYVWSLGQIFVKKKCVATRAETGSEEIQIVYRRVPYIINCLGQESNHGHLKISLPKFDHTNMIFFKQF